MRCRRISQATEAEATAVDPAKKKKKGTKLSGLSLLLIGIVVVAAIAGVAAALIFIPGLAQNVIWIILIIILAIVIAALLIWAIVALLAIPVYMKKGESYQTDMKYDIEDVKPVKESSGSDEKKEK